MNKKRYPETCSLLHKQTAGFFYSPNAAIILSSSTSEGLENI